MQAVWIFLAIFCGVFGAAELLSRAYRAIIEICSSKRGGGRDRSA